MRKAAFHNLGCKVNSYETEAMQQLLEDAGYEIVPFREGADVYIINTCSVTNVADRKSRQMLHRAKKMNPSAAVVAVGCYVQAAGAELKKDEAVDLIVGNNQKKDLVQILDDYFADHENSGEILDIGHSQEYEELHIRRIADHTRAFIKVQDGCNQFCTYCIIPYARGRVRSREKEKILQEVHKLAQAGYKEVVLTGIHLSSYGVDFKGEEKETLLTLIQAVNEVEGIRRIRLGSLEPGIVTEEFASELAKMPKVCPHFHLSLQSGCDVTLERMNRRYRSAEYRERCEILRKYFGKPALTTDVIVGFPMETEEDFQASYEFVKNIHFYETHIFKYSRRHGTKAAAMGGQLTEAVKAERSDKMLELNQIRATEYENTFLNKEVDVLLEEEIEIEGRAYYLGHTREYIKAAVPKMENYGVNDFLTVKTELFLQPHILLGEEI